VLEDAMELKLIDWGRAITLAVAWCSLFSLSATAGAAGEVAEIATVPRFILGMDIGDVDNDGRVELVCGSPFDKRIYVYDTQYKEKYSLLLAGSPRSILIADLDNDGRNELVMAAGETKRLPCRTDPSTPDCRLGHSADAPGHIYIGEVCGCGLYATDYVSPKHYLRFPWGLAAGDINNNGTRELILGLSWWDRKLVSYEYNGATYIPVFVDNIGSDVLTVRVSGNRLAAGTACYSDYGLRVYGDKYSLLFSNLKRGCTLVDFGDVNGDGRVETVRTIAALCADAPDVYPQFEVYAEQHQLLYASPLLSPPLSQATTEAVLAVGDIIPGGAEEIVIGTMSYAKSGRQGISAFSFNGKGYERVWGLEFSDASIDVYDLKIADLNGDGVKELYAGTTYDLKVFAWRPSTQEAP
jgi:hypothetical protein